MIWAIDVLYIIILTSATGAIAAIMWFWIGKLLEKAGFLNIQYDLMKVVILFWGMPISYFAVRIVDRNGQHWYGEVFVMTPLILTGANIISFLWGIGVFIFLFRFFIQILKVYQVLKSIFPCDARVVRQFNDSCAYYGIPKNKIRLGQTYRSTVPEIAGIIHPTIILPVRDYSEEELKIIFRHELMHARHHDVLLKNVVAFLLVFHYFNPAMWWFQKLLNKWSEFACDYAVCIEEQDIKHYFSVILNMVGEKSSGLLSSGLREDEVSLKERYKHTYRCYKKKDKSHFRASVIVSIMALLSISGVYAFTLSSTIAITDFFKKTRVISDESFLSKTDMKEYLDKDDSTGKLIDAGVCIYDEMERRGTISENELAANTFIQTDLFYVNEKEGISVGISAAQTDAKIRVGIIGPYDSRQFVEGDTAILNEFEVRMSGNYRVFVENIGEEEISVFGSYAVRK